MIKEHPLEILNHTYRHGYADLADLVAIETIGKPLDDIARRLTHPGLLQKWVSILYFSRPNLILSLSLLLSFYTTSVGEMSLQEVLQSSSNIANLLIAIYGPRSKPDILQPWWGILGIIIMSSIANRNPAMLGLHRDILVHAQHLFRRFRNSYPWA